MRRLIVLAVLLFSAAARAQTRGAVDWIFVVDTSKSMLEKDVFGATKESVNTFIREASDGDTVAILTFDRDVRLQSSTIVGRNRDDLVEIVGNLQATGNRTHLGKAIAAGLARHKSDPSRTSAIVLFTDGKEDVRGIADHVPIPSTFPRARESGARIYFVSMNEHEEQLRTYPDARFIEATDEPTIRTIAQTIRKEILEPPPPPQPVARAPIVAVTPPPPPPEPAPWIEPAKWAALLAIIAILALATRIYLKSRNRLEGEIEVVRPHAAYVGLPSLKSDQVALSTIVPLDALAGSDARLFCRHKDGAKKVWIAATAGSLRVNDVEVPTTELYDADTIQIGDAKLRFNRVGFERPQENLA